MNTIPYCLPPHLTAEQFLAEYWQKKPLLIKQGLPQIVGMFEPEDILGLAMDEEATARLITQTSVTQTSINKTSVTQTSKNGENQANDQLSNYHWQVKNSPLSEEDFQDLPEKWTTLVQNLEQWSPELGQLWHAFDFIPQWQRDDIMVSFAPKGGSVGSHYDEYDVFLVQGYGSRRWQLGKYCDENTEYLPNQPIRIFDDMGELIFDEVLEAGDVLYVPIRLSHYGVAESDCLTFSFGFRRPNLMQILDNLADSATTEPSLFIPMRFEQGLHGSGELQQASIQAMKAQLIDMLNSETGDHLITQAISETVSKRQYDILVPEETLTIDEVEQALAEGASLQIDYSSRLIYRKVDHQLTYDNHAVYSIYANGELLTDIDDKETALLVRLADGETLFQRDLATIEIDSIMDWLENGWVWLDF